MRVGVEPINYQLGQWAEQQAFYLLQQHGFHLVKKNFRSRFGEIDLIVERGQTLIFVEVKARSSCDYGYAIEMVRPSQQRKIIKTAHFFLACYPKYQEFFCQFDVISFDFMQKIAKNIQYDFSKLRYDQQWIENAFTL